MYLTVKSLFKRTSLFKPASIFIGVLAIGGILIFFNLYRASLYNELFTLDLIPRTESFTELYFNQNATLPDTATANQEIHFAFVIHNLETTDMQYVYAVSVIAHGKRYIVDHGNVVVKINHYYVKNEQMRLINSPGRQDVIVELTNKRQSIDFWTGK
jgi:hypothetical protein